MKISQSALSMLCFARQVEGADARVTEGSLALAEWIAQGWLRRTAAAAASSGFGTVDQLLAGRVLPGNDWSDALERLTAGAVMGRMFDRDADDAVSDLVRETQAALVETSGYAEVREIVEPETLAVVRGRLGEVPAGPLFSHVIDPVETGSFVLTGLGMAWAFTPATFGALCDAGRRALDDIAANADRVAGRVTR